MKVLMGELTASKQIQWDSLFQEAIQAHDKWCLKELEASHVNGAD